MSKNMSHGLFISVPGPAAISQVARRARILAGAVLVVVLASFVALLAASIHNAGPVLYVGDAGVE